MQERALYSINSGSHLPAYKQSLLPLIFAAKIGKVFNKAILMYPEDGVCGLLRQVR